MQVGSREALLQGHGVPMHKAPRNWRIPKFELGLPGQVMKYVHRDRRKYFI